jgi:hypothetical protein
VNQTRFLNTSQPQTLVIGTLLLYFDAFFNIIAGGPYAAELIIIGLVMAAGGFGIANERRWGYVLGVIGAVLQLLVLLAAFGVDVLGGLVFITLIFDVALIALLVHPMSRDYQKIWFK